jgi:CheY-like chemotaxis protein/anti-sigma regulatory factor (Ser/Thr protein kinase)
MNPVRAQAATARARLLVVDDEEVNREIIAEYLDGEPWALTMAADGASALGLLGSREAYDVVVLDRMMPGVDGMEVLRRMQQDPQLRGIPVVMQTAAASHEQVAQGLELGAYYYLTKPYHRDALVAVIRSALGMSRQRHDLADRIEEYRGVMALIDEGTFRVRTLSEARALAAALGSASADPAAVGLGLVELLVNAIEHGNLGITFEDKAALLACGAWDDEVQARLARPENAAKFVLVTCRRTEGRLEVVIRDQGRGFDWRRFLSMDEMRAFQANGRGISLARQVAFDSLEYRGCGNEVAVSATARARGASAPPRSREEGDR